MVRLVVFLILLASFAEGRAAPPAEAFGTLPRVYDAAISPDGKQIAAIVNFDGTYGIRVMDIDNAADDPRAVLLGSSAKPFWIRWANNDRVLIGLWQSMKHRGTPITASFIYTLDAAKMRGEILIRPRKVFRQYNATVVDFLDHDPDHILMAFSDEDQFIADIQRVNVNNGKYRRVKRGRKDVQRWYTDNRGEPRVGQGRSDRSTEEDAWSLLIRDADDDHWRHAAEYPGLAEDTDIFGFTSDPDELIIGDHAGRSTLGIYIYDLGEKRITRKLFHHDTYDADRVVFNSKGDVIGVRYEAHETETELLDEYETVLERMRQRFASHTVDYIDHSDGTGRILFKVSSAFDPGALALVDAETDKIRFLSHYRPELPAIEMGSVTHVTYKARDGFPVPAYLTLPPSIKDRSQLKGLPFVVLPHGGPYARTSKRFDYFAQFFATRGFGVLQMNFRGSSGYGQDFESAGRENWVLMLEDIEDSTRWLIDEGLADPERICIAGWSYGGYAALMNAIRSPELYACAISMAGVTDLKDMIYDIKKYRFGRMAANNFILKGLDTRQELKENSPVQRADEFTVPLFLAHGELDQRVHFDQFQRMKSALRKAPARVTYMEFPEEDHFLSRQENRQRFFIGLDKFLRETVGESEFAD